MSDTPEKTQDSVSQAAAPEGKKIRDYDFLRPERLSFEQKSVLGRVNETAARGLAVRLQDICRQEANVEAGAPKEVTAAELKETQREKQIIALFSTVTEENKALVSLDSALAHPMVDRILGGSNEAVSVDRTLTELERQVALEGITLLLLEYAQAWSRLRKFSPAVLDSWYERLPEETLAGTDWGISTEFQVKVGNQEGQITICLLQPGCEPLAGRLSTYHWAADRAKAKAEDRAKVIQVLEEVELPVRAVLGTARIPLRELLEITEGDILCLEIEQFSDIQIWAAGKAAFAAKPIMIDGHIGVRVSEQISRGGR
jgi:flagellar motor switch protein FliM